MTDDDIAAALEAEIGAGNFMPPAWRGKLDMQHGYRVQLAWLRRRVGCHEREVDDVVANAHRLK